MKTSTSTSRADLYTRVTDRVVSDLEKGIRTWTKPWTSTGNGRVTIPRRHNGMAYRRINVLILWGEAIERGYTAPLWMTYRQAMELGANVRKGEHGSTVVYADRIVRKETGNDGAEIEKAIPFLKSYTVFNVEQIDNLPAQSLPQPEPQRDRLQLIATAEAFIAATGATIRHGGDHYNFPPEQRRAIEVFYIRDLVDNAKDKNFERTAKEFYLAGLLRPPYPDCLFVADLGNGLSVLYLLTGGDTIVEYAHSRRAGFLERNADHAVRLVDGELRWDSEDGESVPTVVIASLMTLCMKPIDRERIEIADALNKRRAERGRSKLLPFTIIRNPPASHTAQGGTHASPLPHWRRGHVRRYKSGKTVIIEPTLVNAHVREPVKRKAYMA